MADRVYFDSCCFIELAKGHGGKALAPDRKIEIAVCNELLNAAMNGNLEIFTSAITLAEVVHIGDLPVAEDTKAYLSRLLLSGRNGVTLVQPSPFTLEAARDLCWVNGIGKGAADRIHVASAIEMGCKELLTIDGSLAKRLGNAKIGGCPLISPSATTLLPNKSAIRDLFTGTTNEPAPKA